MSSYNNGHIWDHISPEARYACDTALASQNRGAINPHDTVLRDIPHWVQTEYDAHSVIMLIDEAACCADDRERKSKLDAAREAARRIVTRGVLAHPIPPAR